MDTEMYLILQEDIVPIQPFLILQKSRLAIYKTNDLFANKRKNALVKSFFLGV